MHDRHPVVPRARGGIITDRDLDAILAEFDSLDDGPGAGATITCATSWLRLIVRPLLVELRARRMAMDQGGHCAPGGNVIALEPAR